MKIHLIAIGGSAMHNMALALHHKGFKVTGSDDAIFSPSKERLKKHELLPNEMGWFPDKITSDLDAIILGMHARENNPELAKAKELNIPVFSYPEYIYEQSKNKKRVVIGGSHGKTSITAMILHVLQNLNIDCDYMVGAQLDGFDTMVKLTHDAPIIILEGDEYLSSPIDRRSKFHLYKPHIAVLSGIAWDHINVFPTFEGYVNQFRIFTDSLTDGGIMVYNEEDAILKEVVESSTHSIKKYEYSTPVYQIEDGVTYIDTPDGLMPLEIFGDHNLQNLAGAKWVCQHMGIDEEDFYEAIASFKGASKRLEKIAESSETVIYKDFAHSPSKVKATTEAVKKQYPQRDVIACLELHTYSSLNAAFLAEYNGALDKADKAVVFYSPHAVKIKQLDSVSEEQISNAFQRDDLIIFTNPSEFKELLLGQNLNQSAVVLMSSGNYGGLDFEEVKRLV